ncbi:MAG: CPBP family intramembrane glutamic endopeptidase [Armatimonadota bacterium]|nr:CPBP family intramembrane metalloprotease [bacterium]
MSLFETCARLAAYLTCIGLALELSHRFYWKLNSRVTQLQISTSWRSILGITIATLPMGTAVVITATFVTVLDNQSLLTLGLRYDGDSMVRVAYGAGIALGCVTLAFLTGLLLGHIDVKPSKMSDDCVACLPLFLGGLIDFMSAAIFEEVIFRGYVFYILLESAGLMPAVVVSSAIFSLAHLLKHRNTPVFFTINAFIFGLILALCRYHTGTLWLPIGLHFGWNVVSGPIFGLPYSGRSYERGVVVSDVSGPLWLTGGSYSLDAGALGTIALAVAAVGLLTVAPMPW